MKICYVEVNYKNREVPTVFRVPITDTEDESPQTLTYDQVITAVMAGYEDLQPAIYLPHLAPLETEAADVFIRPTEINFVLVAPVREETEDDIAQYSQQVGGSGDPSEPEGRS